VPARLRVFDDLSDLAEHEQTVVYRVVQESLSLLARHAHASCVVVEIGRDHGRPVVRVVDDGRGLAPASDRTPASGSSACANAHAWPAAGSTSTPRREAAPPSSCASTATSGRPPRVPRRRDAAAHRRRPRRRAGRLRFLLERQPDMEVVAEAADGAEAVQRALIERPDVCVLDVAMPKLTGLQATREIRAQAPEIAVLILSMHDDDRYLFEALKAGAAGYVLKKEADQFLVDALRAVTRGEPFLTNAAQRALVRDWMADDSTGPTEPLTPREQEVLKLIAEAHTNRRSARSSISPRRPSSRIGPISCASSGCVTASSSSATRFGVASSSPDSPGPADAARADGSS